MHNAISLYFIAFNSGAPWYLAITSWAALSALLTLTGPMFTLPQNLLFRRWGSLAVLFAPICWTAIEYLRSLGEIAFPWNILALSQSTYLAPCQIAAYAGIWGLGFWVAMTNSLIFLFIKKGWGWIIPALLWVLFPFMWGSVQLHHPPEVESKLEVAVVQGNVDPAGKWAYGLIYNLNLYRECTLKIADADLIVWPETAVPANLNQSLRPRRFLKDLIHQINIPVFTGALAQVITPEFEELRFNSAYLIKPGDEDLTRFDKIHLVPFGERVPFQKLIPRLGRLNFGQAEFTPGTDYTVFQLDSVHRFGGMICFEAIFPQLAQRYVQDGANFLINITNDGWYGKTAEPHQQGLLSRFRAIENGRSLVRCANTGISYIFDPQGRILRKSNLEETDILQAEIPICSHRTFYQQHSDIFPKIMLILSFLLLFMAIILNIFKMGKGVLILVPVFLFLFQDSASAEAYFMTLSTSASHRFSLASPAAFEGYVGETPVNPAGFNHYGDEYKPRFELLLNPVGAVVAAKGIYFMKQDDFNTKNLALPLVLLCKGIVFSYRALETGLVFWEEEQTGQKNQNFFEYYPLIDDYNQRFFMQLELNEKIDIGVSTELFSEWEKVKKVGISYGVLLKPGKLHAGVFYYILPVKNQHDYEANDRIINQTVNAGLSWQPSNHFKCYFDLRNVSEEEAPAFLEPHIGFETVPWLHTAMRAGYYRKEGEENALAVGIGLFDLNLFRSTESRSQHPEYLLDYCYIMLPGQDSVQAFSLHFSL